MQICSGSSLAVQCMYYDRVKPVNAGMDLCCTGTSGVVLLSEGGMHARTGELERASVKDMWIPHEYRGIVKANKDRAGHVVDFQGKRSRGSMSAGACAGLSFLRLPSCERHSSSCTTPNYASPFQPHHYNCHSAHFLDHVPHAHAILSTTVTRQQLTSQ